MAYISISAGLWQSALIAAAMFVLGQAHAADPKPESAQAAKATGKQKTYGSPEDAVKDLVSVVKANDSKGLLSILGPDGKSIASSGDKVADRENGERFVKSYEEGNKLDKSGDAKAVLSIGKDNWPFPIPVVKDAAGWHFDTKAGLDELLNRRIGRNELAVIQVAQAYADAQREYYLRNPQNAKLLQYAQKIASAPGKRDGLYYPTKSGEPQSPLGPLVSGAKAAGYSKGEDGKPAAY